MPDHAFKYFYEVLHPDGSCKSTLEIVVFFWKNLENIQNDTPEVTYENLKGILILYIRDEHQHDYELSDFPDDVKAAILAEINRFMKAEGGA